jgi:hypothetical protein
MRVTVLQAIRRAAGERAVAVCDGRRVWVLLAVGKNSLDQQVFPKLVGESRKSVSLTKRPSRSFWARKSGIQAV